LHRGCHARFIAKNNAPGWQGGQSTARAWSLGIFAALKLNPKGIVSFSPGLRGTSYPGNSSSVGINSERVESGNGRDWHHSISQSLAKI
jgi:hypothetical protein